MGRRIQVFIILKNNSCITGLGLLTQRIKLVSESKDNHFVPDNNEYQEGDSDINIDSGFIWLLIRTCCVSKIVSYITFLKIFWVIKSQALRSRGEDGALTPRPPQSSLFMCSFLLMSSLNVLFLKEVTQNVHENQQAKSWAS